MMISTIAPFALSLSALLGASGLDATTSETAESAQLKRQVTAQLREVGIVSPMAIEATLKLAGTGSKMLYFVRGSNAGRNREVTGAVVDSIQGVPAQPVDSGVFDGVGREQLSRATVWMVLDPVNDTGVVFSSWLDSHGAWTYTRTLQAPPAHPTGLRIGPDATTIVPITDGVQTHGYQHGNTVVAGGPLMPTVFQHLSSYGPTQVTLNGVPFLNTYSGPTAPDWFGAVKVSDGVRDDNDGTVRNTSGGIFSPMAPNDGATDPNDLEIQVIFHDNPLPVGSSVSNFPPRHRFFYWLNFENVSMRVIQL